MRLATVFKRVLRLTRERVVDVEIRGEAADEEVVVEIARDRRAKMRCPGCSFTTRATYDRTVRTWRHLDCLRTRCLLRCEVRRIDCPTCGVVTEEVPWARKGARVTRAFEDTCVWLAKAAPKSVVAEFMRIDWDTVGRMIERVVDEARGASGDWLDGLTRIGIDEVAWRKGHRYLMVVTDHATGRIVWTHPGRSKKTLERFFADLGPERATRLEAVSVDLIEGWPKVIALHAPQATVCADPFHVVALAGKALDTLRRQDWQRLRKDDPERATWLKGTRFVLRRRSEDLKEEERSVIEELAHTNERVYHGWLLYDQLRAVYRQDDPDQAATLFNSWLDAAFASGLEPFEKLACTLIDRTADILAAIELGVSNARTEAMNSTVRLISHRSRGFKRLESLQALLQLVCGKIPVALPT